ncbi:hypothetical protein [Halomarina pelagica]|uniref:hypothetical protein n=1 Tax=Halomarina pelagica TaxID=2961599 RepID=UPI0020C41D91|nr:hypothetical protein [Halomarina sp. BND7]
MVSDQLAAIATAVSLLVGVVAIGLSSLAYVRFRHTSYRRMLLPLIAVTSLFTVAHALSLAWPDHPLVVDLLEPLAFTGLVVGVLRLVQLHPRISDAVRGERP